MKGTRFIIKKIVSVLSVFAISMCMVSASTVNKSLLYAEAAVKGDVNNDGVLDSKDATVILIKYADALLNNKTLSSLDLSGGDYNNDGYVDSKDATAILIAYAQYLLDSGDYTEPVSFYMLWDTLFVMDGLHIFGMTESQLSNALGKTLPKAVDFPYWSSNLTIIDYTWNGLDIYFVFKNGKLAVVGHDSTGSYHGRHVQESASYYYNSEFNGNDYIYISQSVYFNCEEDTYATTGEMVYHQRYISDLYYS